MGDEENSTLSVIFREEFKWCENSVSGSGTGLGAFL